MLAPKYRELKVGDIKAAPYNPANRVAERKLKQLADSMSRYGLIYPVVVDAEHTLIDGHRRRAAAQMLGWETIPAVLMNGGTDRDAVYASVNETSAKMAGNDALGVWLQNPKAVGRRQASTFESMAASIGRDLVQKVFDDGMSSRVFSTAKRICRYCDDTSDGTVRAVVEWLLQYAVIGRVMKAMEAGEDPRTIMKAVKQKKPIRLRLTVE